MILTIMTLSPEKQLSKFVLRCGISAALALAVGCAPKQPEAVTAVPTRPVAASPKPVPTEIPKASAIPSYTQRSSEVSTTVILTTPGRPESGSITYQVYPQALIRQMKMVDEVFNPALDIRISMETTRLSPPGLLTINTAPQLAYVETILRIGRVSENHPMDAFGGTSNTWELRPSHTMRIIWDNFCFTSMFADGEEQITTRRCPRPTPGLRA